MCERREVNAAVAVVMLGDCGEHLLWGPGRFTSHVNHSSRHFTSTPNPLVSMSPETTPIIRSTLSSSTMKESEVRSRISRPARAELHDKTWVNIARGASHMSTSLQHSTDVALHTLTPKIEQRFGRQTCRKRQFLIHQPARSECMRHFRRPSAWNKDVYERIVCVQNSL